MMKLLILNGPNLNLLSKREKNHYGTFSYEELNSYILSHEINKNNQITIKQSNREYEIIEMIQALIDSDFDGLIINPAAYSHYSIAILDALLILSIPIIEVHLSDVENREDFRQKLITANAASHVISGKSKEGYIEAIKKIQDIITQKHN